MKVISFLVVVSLSLVKTETKAQLSKTFKSDSLRIYTEKIDKNIKPFVCKMKFVSEFNDSIQVYLNNKLLFSKFVKPNSSIASTDVDLSIGYIDLPTQKKTKIKILFLNEKIRVKS